MVLFLQFFCLGKCTGISFIDSTPLRVCHIRREHSHKVFKGMATKGQCSIGWFFGFKLHIVINDKGEIISSFREIDKPLPELNIALREIVRALPETVSSLREIAKPLLELNIALREIVRAHPESFNRPAEMFKAFPETVRVLPENANSFPEIILPPSRICTPIHSGCQVALRACTLDLRD